LDFRAFGVAQAVLDLDTNEITGQIQRSVRDATPSATFEFRDKPLFTHFQDDPPHLRGPYSGQYKRDRDAGARRLPFTGWWRAQGYDLLNNSVPHFHRARHGRLTRRQVSRPAPGPQRASYCILNNSSLVIQP
jgi:hypothetical protein